MALDPITGIADLVKDGIDKIWPSKTQEEIDKTNIFMAQLNAALDVRKLQLQIDLAAEQQKGWLSKGRDGALWTCVFGFAWGYVLLPMLDFACSALGHPVTFPVLNSAPMSDLLTGLLGVGALHAGNQAVSTWKGRQ